MFWINTIIVHSKRPGSSTDVDLGVGEGCFMDTHVAVSGAELMQCDAACDAHECHQEPFQFVNPSMQHWKVILFQPWHQCRRDIHQTEQIQVGASVVHIAHVHVALTDSVCIWLQTVLPFVLQNNYCDEELHTFGSCVTLLKYTCTCMYLCEWMWLVCSICMGST